MIIKGITKSKLKMPVDRMMEDFGMGKAITVKEIVEKYLKENGFDGLFYPGECACKLGALVPCDELDSRCTAGYLAVCDCGKGNGFHIVPEKPEGK